MAYDPGRDCLWILNDVLGASGPHSLVALVQLNASTGALSPTSVVMNGDEFIKGAIELDSNGDVWFGWGRTLAKYNPSADAVQSWSLPSYTGLIHTPPDVEDGRLVAMAVASSGEVWVLAQNVEAIFGFNPSTKAWDRTLNVPMIPVDTSRVAESTSGTVLVTGLGAGDSSNGSLLASIDTTQGTFTTLAAHVIDFAMTDSDHATYVDDSRSVGRLAVAADTITPVTKAPVAHAPDLVADSAGRVWFSMVGYRSVGVGRVDPLGAITTFPFPYIVNPGSPMANDCPTSAFHCVPSSAIFDPEIQALALDKHGKLWVITRVAGGTASAATPSAMYAIDTSS
jgi:hypothetical protein